MGKRVGGAATAVDHHHHQHLADVTTSSTPHTARSIRKRKRVALIAETTAAVKPKCMRMSHNNHHNWQENVEDDDDDDEEESSSNDAVDNAGGVINMQTPQNSHLLTNTTSNGKHHHMSSNTSHSLLMSATFNASHGGTSDHNASSVMESPKPVYTLRPSVVNGTILRDLKSKPWRLGKPIGKGNFGEIFLASDDVITPVTNENAKFVVKVEPHSNGPLFVEIHCLMNTANKANRSSKNFLENGDVAHENSIKTEEPEYYKQEIRDHPPSGIPDYIATGSHYFDDVRYRFLVLPRFDRDLHTLIKNTQVHQKSLLTMAIHIVNVLENLHDCGYCHNDIKAQNLMISKCKYFRKQIIKATSRNKSNNNNNKLSKSEKYHDDVDDYHYEEKQQTTDSGNSSEQEAAIDDDFYAQNEKFDLKRKLYNDDEDDEDFDDGATTNSNNSNSNSNSLDMYHTPVNKKRAHQRRRNNAIEYSGSNPVRSCRRDKRHSIYEEMVKSHYLRPTKRISYSELFNEDGMPVQEESRSGGPSISSDTESEEFLPNSVRRTASSKKLPRARHTPAKRITRRRNQQQPPAVVNGGGGISTRSTRTRSNGILSCATTTTTGTNVNSAQNGDTTELKIVEEERLFLIDFGLASKFQDRGVHRPFIMDQRRAHDGTLEFTSRDAHLGAHSRRSDLECLGYNLLYWSQGYLPWKDAAVQQQQEKVHRSKELLMTDVREMLKQIYGKQVPKYLGEFLHHIGQLGYQQRPDYERYRNIFKREYQQLGYNYKDMQLNSMEILQTCRRVKDEPEAIKCDIFELNNSVLQNSVLGTPFQDHSFTTRVSPKNLRSKSDKKQSKKKKFSWTEVLSQDPDQIARERAVKEFEREEVICPWKSRKPRQYDGKPTYAILQVLQTLRSKGKAVPDVFNEQDDNSNDNDYEEEEADDKDQDDDYEEEEEVTSDGEEQQSDDDDDEEEVEEEEDDDDDEEEGDDDEEEEEQDSEDNLESDNTESSDIKTTRIGARRITKRTLNNKLRIPIENGVERLRSKGGNTGATAVTNNKYIKKTRRAALKPETMKFIKRSAAGGNKRGSATITAQQHKEQNSSTAASAAGEVELQKTRKMHHHHNGGQIFAGDGGGGGGCKTRKQRTRRCIIKTESVENGNDDVLDDGSNSNFGTDINGLYNIWDKFDNESIFAKGRKTAAANTVSTKPRK